jgi:hypothetical protein
MADTSQPWDISAVKSLAHNYLTGNALDMWKKSSVN